MSRRRILSSSAAALALVLVAPTAALADSGHGNSGDHAKSSASNGDPAGNNGTIKIDYPAPADSGHANRPHPGCAFQLRMFGFDDDQYGTITFVGQAPTKGVVTLAPERRLLSDDAAGGGKDVDEVYSYTAEQLGLLGKPQAKQGWHIKVSVDAENAPGGAKHKVFWLKCPAPTATTATGSAGGAATSASTVTTKSLTETTEGAAASGTAAAAASATRRASSVRTAPVGSGETATSFSGGSGSAALSAARPAAAKRTATVNRGSGLPFTGVALGTMLALALGALVAGALAIHVGRRRTASAL